MLPLALEQIPVTISWNLLGALIAFAVAVYGGWSLWRYRKRQDLFIMLLGLYVMALQLPVVVPPLGQALGITCPLGSDYASRFIRIAPVVALLVAANVWDS